MLRIDECGVKPQSAVCITVLLRYFQVFIKHRTVPIWRRYNNAHAKKCRMTEITLIFIITTFIVGTYWLIDSETRNRCTLRLLMELVQKMSLQSWTEPINNIRQLSLYCMFTDSTWSSGIQCCLVLESRSMFRRNTSSPSSGSKIVRERKVHESGVHHATWFQSGFILCLFGPEGLGDMFLRNVFYFQRATLHYIPEDSTLLWEPT
jgi:hypothetical protein